MHCCQKQARDILNEHCRLSFVEWKETCHCIPNTELMALILDCGEMKLEIK